MIIERFIKCFPLFCIYFPLAEYIAMYTYESSEQGDLTFQQGDMILVTKKDGDWWTGTLGDKSGVFPSNYVRLKDSEVETLNCYKIELGEVRFVRCCSDSCKSVVHKGMKNIY